jgi:hypothetical protein
VGEGWAQKGGFPAHAGEEIVVAQANDPATAGVSICSQCPIRSGDFGLVPDEAYEPTLAKSNKKYHAAF